MLTLYYKPFCSFCQKVLAEAEEIGVVFELKDITADEKNAEELLSLGGKKQVPFLVDGSSKVRMYESGDIIDYIRKGKKDIQTPTVKVHKSAGSSKMCV
jgi:glutathione S-transferase